MRLGELPFPFQLLLVEFASPSDERQVTGDQEGEPRDPEQERHRSRQKQERSAQGNGDLHSRCGQFTVVRG